MTEPIDKISTHNYSQSVADNDEDTHKEICTCGEQRLVPHDWNNGVTVVEPTVTDKGVKRYTCVDCGRTRDEILDKIAEELPKEDGNDSVDEEIDKNITENNGSQSVPDNEDKAQTSEKNDDSSNADKSGCGASVTSVAVIVPLICSAVAFITRKRKDD
jgi:hypothetical protein